MFLHFKTTSFICNKQAFRDFNLLSLQIQTVGLGIKSIKFQLHQDKTIVGQALFIAEMIGNKQLFIS